MFTDDFDPVFGDETTNPADIVQPTQPTLFAGKADSVAQAEETRLRVADENRANDQRIGLLIGPKNLIKLRAFGFDVVLVNADHHALAAGVAHRGLTE